MVNGLHLYSAFIQSTVQFMPLIHPFTHQQRLAAMQGTNQLVRSNWGLGVLLRNTSTHPGWDRTGDTPTARRQLLLPEPHRPTWFLGSELVADLKAKTKSSSPGTGFQTPGLRATLCNNGKKSKRDLWIQIIRECSESNTNHKIFFKMSINHEAKR